MRHTAQCRQGLAVIIAVFVMTAAVTTFAGSASDAIRATHEDFLRVLNNDEFRSPVHGAPRYELARVISTGFYSADMAHYVLGQHHWEQLSDGERDEFVRLFQLLLVTVYARHIDRYAKNTPLYMDEFSDANQAIVHARVVDNTHRDIALDFRLLQREGKWRAYDMTIDGMSLIQNYRAQFARLLRVSSYANAVYRLRATVCIPDCNELLGSESGQPSKDETQPESQHK